uniref:Uncharacterized protein n=1 Tax=Anguilla anguilla TaxID=7936 RepID=A0A0E9PY11_ANGAN
MIFVATVPISLFLFFNLHRYISNKKMSIYYNAKSPQACNF